MDTGELRYQISGHQDLVTFVAFAPDGKTLISASRDGTGLVWDLNELRKYEPPAERAVERPDLYGDPLPPGVRARMGSVRFRHGSGIHSVAFSPDSKTVLVGAAGNAGVSLCLWDVGTGKELRRFHGYENHWTNHVAFSPDGRTVAASTDATIYFWEAATGKRLGKLIRHKDSINCFAFSPDGKIVAAAGGYRPGYEDFAIRLWDLETGEETCCLVGHETAVSQIMFTPDGKELLSFSSDGGVTDGKKAVIPGSVRRWDLATRESVRQYKIRHDWVRFSPDGKTLVFRDEGKQFCLWDMITEETIIHLPGEHTSWAFSTDGKILVARDDSKMIRVLEAATGKELRRFDGFEGADVSIKSLAADGKTLAVSHYARLRLCDIVSGKELRPFGGHRETVACVAFTPDGKSVVSGSEDKTLRVWASGTGKELCLFAGHRSAITAIAVAPDGTVVASGDTGDRISVWETTTGKEQQRFHQPKISYLTFTPDGKNLVAVGRDGTAHIWELATGKLVRRLDGHPWENSTASLSPDGKLLVSTYAPEDWLSGTGSIILWDIATGRELRSIEGMNGERFWSVAFSPDGKMFAASASTISHGGFGSHEGNPQIRLWEVATGQETLALETPGHNHSLVFTPDGKTLITDGAWELWSEGTTIRLWDLARKEEFGRLAGHLGSATCLALSPEGKSLVSGSSDSTILVWDIRSPAGKKRVSLDNPSAEIMRERWSELTGTDAARAFQAARSLTAEPRQTLEHLRKHLQPPLAPDRQHIARMIADLDDDHFAVREKATLELDKHLEFAEAELRKTLAGQPSPEVQRRGEALLAKLHSGTPPEHLLQAIRATAVLEQIGTAEAGQILESLAGGPPDAWLTQEAKASLKRLNQRNALTLSK